LEAISAVGPVPTRTGFLKNGIALMSVFPGKPAVPPGPAVDYIRAVSSCFRRTWSPP
jgi:hypothetical protein